MRAKYLVRNLWWVIKCALLRPNVDGALEADFETSATREGSMLNPVGLRMIAVKVPMVF